MPKGDRAILELVAASCLIYPMQSSLNQAGGTFLTRMMYIIAIHIGAQKRTSLQKLL